MMDVPLHPQQRDLQQQQQQQQKQYYDFSKLNNLISRLDALEQEAPELILGFYDSSLQSFSVKSPSQEGEGKQQSKVCITSTCYALLTLALSSDSIYNSILSWEDDDEQRDKEASALQNKIPVPTVMKKMLASNKWRQDDLFQVPLLIYTLLRVDDADRSLLRQVLAMDSSQTVASKVQSMIQTVLKGRPHRKYGTKQVHSDYIIYQICKVLALLQESSQQSPISLSQPTEEHPPENDEATTATPLSAIIPQGVATEVFWGLLRCAEISSNELCRQLAYRTAGDLNSFDVIRLVYSLLTYLCSTESLSGIAGFAIPQVEADDVQHENESSQSSSGSVAGAGPSPETRVPPLNKKLVAAALAAFFEEQGSDGLWDKGQPIYKSFKEGKGRHMGGAFVFSVNTVGSLLCALPAEAFRPHLAALERTLEWIENHQRLEIVSDYIDPESGQCYGKPLRGWTSPHLSTPDAGPQAWSTAQVLKCVTWMSRTIRQLMHNDVLREFNGIIFSKNGIQSADWDRLLDTDLGKLGGDSSGTNNSTADTEAPRTLKSVLEERVVAPFSKSIDNPSYGAAYSAILFGPPGTAKTT